MLRLRGKRTDVSGHWLPGTCCAAGSPWGWREKHCPAPHPVQTSPGNWRLGLRHAGGLQGPLQGERALWATVMAMARDRAFQNLSLCACIAVTLPRFNGHFPRERFAAVPLRLPANDRAGSVPRACCGSGCFQGRAQPRPPPPVRRGCEDPARLSSHPTPTAGGGSTISSHTGTFPQGKWPWIRQTGHTNPSG